MSSIFASLLRKFNTKRSLLRPDLVSLVQKKTLVIRPTAEHIIGVKRPAHPKYFDESTILHYEIAVPADKDLLMRFLIEQFLPHDMYNKALGGMTEDDVLDSYNEVLDVDLADGVTLMGFLGNKIVACSSNHIEQIPYGHKQITDFTTPEWNKLKDDYQEDIDNGPYKSVKANTINAVLQAVERDYKLTFPPGAKLFFLRRGWSHDDYKRRGYSLETNLLAIRRGYELGCTHLISRLVVVGSQGLFAKGASLAAPDTTKCIRSIKYDDFRASGKPAFNFPSNLHTDLVWADFKNFSHMF